MPSSPPAAASAAASTPRSASHPPGRPLHLAWAAFQRRQVAMAPLADMDCCFVPLGYKGRSQLRRAVAYLAAAWRTWRELRTRQPRELWLQLPQVPLLWLGLLYRALAPHPVQLVADCHNAMFRAPWVRFPFALPALARCELVVVHNDEVWRDAIALGLAAERLLVLEDVPLQRDDGTPVPPVPARLVGRPRPWVVFPGSFGADEPVAEVLEAARQLRGRATVVVTGRLSNAAKNGHVLDEVPDNVLLTDYVPVAELDALLEHCDLVLALTRHDGIQLSVCNEALGFGRAMVMSDTPLLRRLFGEAAMAVDSSSPQRLACAIDGAAARRQALERSAVALAARRRQAWLQGAWSECRQRLAVPTATSGAGA